MPWPRYKVAEHESELLDRAQERKTYNICLIVFCWAVQQKKLDHDSSAHSQQWTESTWTKLGALAMDKKQATIVDENNQQEHVSRTGFE